MQKFEYKAVPAPHTGKSGKGIKGTPAKFANHLTQVINEMAADGWEYQRADTLPCEERSGLTSKVTKFQNVLVFRREIAAAVRVVAAPVPVVAPTPPEEVPEPIVETPVRIVADGDEAQDVVPERTPLRAIKREDEAATKSSGDLTAS